MKTINVAVFGDQLKLHLLRTKDRKKVFLTKMRFSVWNSNGSDKIFSTFLREKRGFPLWEILLQNFTWWILLARFAKISIMSDNWKLICQMKCCKRLGKTGLPLWLQFHRKVTPCFHPHYRQELPTVEKQKFLPPLSTAGRGTHVDNKTIVHPPPMFSSFSALRSFSSLCPLVN